MKNTYKLTLYIEEDTTAKIEFIVAIDSTCVNPEIFLDRSQEKYNSRFVQKVGPKKVTRRSLDCD